MDIYPEYINLDLNQNLSLHSYNQYYNNHYTIFYQFYYIFRSFCILSFIITTGITSSVIIISILFYYPMIETFNKLYIKNKDLLECDNFLFEYLDEYEQLPNIEISQNNLNLLNIKFFKYQTNFGNIIMNYDFKNNSFNYYSKKSNIIPFEYLDVISRMYVVKYECKNIYTFNDNDNYNDNYNDNNNHNDNDIWHEVNNHDVDNQEIDNKNSVFYKKENNLSQSKSKKYYSNKYKYKGTIKDFIDKVNNYNFKYYDYTTIEQIYDISSSNNLLFYLVHNKFDNFDYIDDEPIIKDEKENISFCFFKKLIGTSNNKQERTHKINNSINDSDDESYKISKDIFDKKNK